VRNRRFIFFAIAFLYFSGCDIFQTRDPESPNKVTSGYKPPVTPDIVLENFKSAVRDHNVDNYIKCFIDSTASSGRFSFSPSAGYENQLTNWNLEDEQRYFQNLGIPSVFQPSLSLSATQEVNRTATSTEYTMEYILFYPHNKPDVAQQVKGYMHLYLHVDNQQRWAISLWEDRRVASDSTWSYLKYHFY